MSKGKNNKNNKKVNVPQTKDKDVEEKSTEEKSTEPEIESKEETLPPIRPPRHSHSWLCRHLNHLRTPPSILPIFPTPLTSRRSTSGSQRGQIITTVL